MGGQFEDLRPDPEGPVEGAEEVDLELEEAIADMTVERARLLDELDEASRILAAQLAEEIPVAKEAVRVAAEALEASRSGGAVDPTLEEALKVAEAELDRLLEIGRAHV